MMLMRTTSLAFAAASLTAIVTMPAYAQTAGPYSTAPGYTTPQGPAAYGTTQGYTAPQGPAAYGTTPGYTAPQSPAAYGTTQGYTAPQSPAAYGTTPGYTAPQGPAAYGTTPGYTTPQGAATSGSAPSYTTGQGAASYGSAPNYNSPQSSVPQANQSGAAQSASARRNVIESHEYDRAVESNRAFRQARIRKECGPITDPELRQSCLASFNQEEPQTGSSTSSRSHGSGSGR
jgi:hypothetical protein